MNFIYLKSNYCYTDLPRWSFLLWILQQYPGSPWQMLKDLLINNNYHLKWYLILEIKNKLKCNCSNTHKKWTKRNIRILNQTMTIYIFTLYTLTSVCIFSILFSIHFLMHWQGEFVKQSRGSSVAYHFLCSRDLNVWFRVDIERRN